MKNKMKRLLRRLEQEGIRSGTYKILRYLGHRKVPKYIQDRIEARTLSDEDLIQVVSNAGTQYRYYDLKHKYRLSPPTYPSDLGEEVRNEFRSIYPELVSTKRPSVCEIPDVTFPSSFSYPTCSYGYLPEHGMSASSTAIGLLLAATRGISPRGRSLIKPTTRFDKVISLAGLFDKNYYHWFRDYLPRLEGLEHIETGASPPIVLIPNDPPEWLQDSLRFIGAYDYRVREWPEGAVHADKYLLSRYRLESTDEAISRSPLMSPRSYRWMGNRILEGADIRTAKTARIYISRADATTRRTSNEDEVMDILSKFGFKQYKLGQMKFEQQIELFANADAIVGAHGAGLINMMFSRDASILELLGPKTRYADPGQFYTMAEVLGHEYGCLEANCVGRDLHIDLDELERICVKLFK